MHHFTNYAEAVKSLRANLTPRQLVLEVLERFVDGTYADGLPDWFADCDVPLWERKPCIIYQIASSAISSNVDLVVGESRFPAITSNPGEDDSEAEGLDEGQSKKVDRAIAELQDRTRFHSVARQALQHAQGSKSVATIAGTRDGRPFLELVRSRWCEEPTVDASGNVLRLDIRYPYLQPQKQPDGTWKMLALLYRRIIDDKSDTTFLPVPADPSGREPKAAAWVVDKDRTVQHGLGFCPVHWYAHMKECSTVADYDGHAIHETLLDEIRGLDFTLSQRHRSALFAGDPQITEIGVQPGSNPSGPGRTAVVPVTPYGGSPSAANPVIGSHVDTSVASARRKSPGVVWQYEDANTKVEYLTLPVGALDALNQNAEGLRDIICEGLAYAPIDSRSSKMLTALSSKAIESLRARQFDRCDQIRDDFGPCWLLPVTNLMLRVSLATDVKIPAVAAARELLSQHLANEADAPLLFIRWPGDYVRPDPLEEQAVVSSTVAAKTAGLITLRMAVQKLAPIYGVSNVDQAVEAIEQEREENQKRALEVAAATAKTEPVGDGAADDEPTEEDRAA